MDDKSLVVGGTGMLGQPVVRRLLSSGMSVRVMTRRPDQVATQFGVGVEVVAGDVDNTVSLAKAVQSCSGVHVSLDGKGDWDLERRGTLALCQAARTAGVQRIALISGASACEENAWFVMTRAKLDAEDAVRASGVPFTIFRCTIFMELLPNLVKEGKALVIGKQPNPWHFVAAADYAAMVARSYEIDAALGKTLCVYGPELLTMEQALEQYRAICTPGAKLVRVPFWVLALMALAPNRRELREVGLPIMRYFAKVKEVGDPSEANLLLGAPSTTLQSWCRQKAQSLPTVA
jgi:uncharacterized protein YbjT (DUF2867 family)